MEPVEIDIRMKQNVTEEGKKATGAIGEMDEAAKKMQEQVESMLEQRKKLMNVGHRPPLLLDHTGIGSRLNNWRINGF